MMRDKVIKQRRIRAKQGDTVKHVAQQQQAAWAEDRQVSVWLLLPGDLLLNGFREPD
jgi:hypothetical protein